MTDRLSAGAEEYRTLFRKYVALEQSIALDRDHANAQLPVTTIDDPIEQKPVEYVPPKVQDEQDNFRDVEEELDAVLRNSDNDVRDVPYEEEERQQQRQASFNRDDSVVRKCPVCDWEFPEQMNSEGRNQHTESHFQ